MQKPWVQTYNDRPLLTKGMSLIHPNWIANSLISSLFLQTFHISKHLTYNKASFGTKGHVQIHKNRKCRVKQTIKNSLYSNSILHWSEWSVVSLLRHPTQFYRCLTIKHDIHPTFIIRKNILQIIDNITHIPRFTKTSVLQINLSQSFLIDLWLAH